MKKVFISFALALAAVSTSYAHKLTIRLNGVENEKGQIGIAVFSEAHFMDYNQLAWGKFVEPKTGTVTVECDLPDGKYAVMVMHDENKNFTVDLAPNTGIPTEPTGMSNNPTLRGFPTFDQIGFSLNQDKTIDIQMVRYMAPQM